MKLKLAKVSEPFGPATSMISFPAVWRCTDPAVRLPSSDPSSHTQDGATPLYLAGEKGNLECMEILLAANANTELALQVRGPSFQCRFSLDRQRVGA